MRFSELEASPVGTRVPLQDAVGALRFDGHGLIPAIAQQHDTGEVLMLAWMSAETLQETLDTGRVCYYSRSRGRPWRKGESSGHVQYLVELRVDCDGDTLLLRVDQQGPACHTGRASCFYLRASEGALEVCRRVDVDPTSVYPPLGPSNT